MGEKQSIPQHKQITKEEQKNTTNSTKQKVRLSLGVPKISSFIGKSSKALLNTYTLGKKLGSGSYGSVFIGTHKVTAQKRAIKQMKKSLLRSLQEDVLYEFNILKELDHPNITRVYEAYEDASTIYIVSELFEGGDLYQRMSTDKYIDEHKASIIVKQILIALAYCHSMNLLHRDLKPQNVMLEDTSLNLKLIDFGFAKYYNPKKLLKGKLGTPYFMAPEIILNQKYDCRVDIWSLGVILISMLSGNEPYRARDMNSLYNEIISSNFTEHYISSKYKHFSPAAVNFIAGCLKPNLAERSRATDLLNHPWIKKENPHMELSPDLVKQLSKNVKRTVGASRMQSAISSYMALNAARNSQIIAIKELFLKLDTSKDGKLSWEEIMVGFRLYPKEMPFNVYDMQKYFSSMDKDGSQTIEYTEFVQALMNQAEMSTEENLKAAFGFFDCDGNGLIDAKEMKIIFDRENSYIDQNAIQAMLDEVDQSKDGMLNFKEFKRITVEAYKHNKA